MATGGGSQATPMAWEWPASQPHGLKVAGEPPLGPMEIEICASMVVPLLRLLFHVLLLVCRRRFRCLSQGSGGRVFCRLGLRKRRSEPWEGRPCVGFLSLFQSLSMSLFSVALSSDGGDWVVTVQSEMGSTGGTWRRWVVMVVKGLRFGY
jgi:hypothetical protein